MSKCQIINGCPFPAGPMFPRKNIEETLEYVPRDGDIIIASYPKTGTTWMQYTVMQIISKGELFPSVMEATEKYAPFLEQTGTSVLENMEKPRMYKHHCPYNLVKKNPKAKYVYIYRKPEDTFVSLFHFMTSVSFQPPDFDELFEEFITGNTGYGHYFDHVLSYKAHKNDEGMLLVSYEKLLRNRKEEILRIAKFLDEEIFQSLCENDSLLEKILEHTSFDYMKKNLPLTHPKLRTEDGEPKKVNFFRKGVVGDGKKTLSPEKLKRIKDLIIERLTGTELFEEWMEE